MKNTAHHQKVNLGKDIKIYLYGVSQYVVQAGWQETLFVLEEDAQRYAKKLSGETEEFAVIRHS